jgi:hypothetical protein
MPMSLRIAIAAVSIVLSIAASAAVLKSTVEPVDGVALVDNPGCGYAGGGWTDLAPGMSSEGVDLCSDRANCTKLWSMQKFSKGYAYQDDWQYYTNHIVNFVGGADMPLTDNALLSISNSLLRCRRNAGTCIPRFAYTSNGWGGAEPDDFEMVIVHIKQIAKVLSQFRDVVPAVECGIIGAYGEMHTSRYTEPEYQNRVVGAWLDNLPRDMALLVRSPPVWMNYLEMTTSTFFGGGLDSIDAALRARMGFYNDGYLGTDQDYGTWGGGTKAWSRSQGRSFLEGQAVSYGGEFAGITDEFFDANVTLLDPRKHNIVKEWYDTHLSYLRSIRSSGMTVTKRLAATSLDVNAWAWDGMPDLSEYDGIDLRKFCEHHMGYRYVVRDVSFGGVSGCGRLSARIENTGFGQLLFDDEIEIVLSGGSGAYPARLRDGSARSLRALRGGASQVFVLDFDYPAGIQPGEYDVFLRVRVPLGDEDGTGLPRRVVRFANSGCYNAALKANFLCRIAIDEDFDLVAGTPWFSWYWMAQCASGGRWVDSASVGEYASCVFATDSGVPRGREGEIKVDMPVDALNEIPQPDGGKASFLFLSRDGSAPAPYGYCAEGWTRLYGSEPDEGRRIVLCIRLAGNRVKYSIGDVDLVDATGRKWLPASGSARTVSEIAFVGNDRVGDFVGTIVEGEGRRLCISIR